MKLSQAKAVKKHQQLIVKDGLLNTNTNTNILLSTPLRGFQG